MRYLGGFATDKGEFRQTNEDAGAVILLKKGSAALCVVCDGIGGLDHGEIASQYITQAADHWFVALLSWLDVDNFDPELVMAHLRDGVESWNREVCEGNLAGGLRSGTTMTLLLCIDDKRFIAHIGDSRLYSYTPEAGLLQLTADEVVSRMVDGRLHGYLANYIGRQNELFYSATLGNVECGELYLCCSDGFYHALDERDVSELYKRLKKENPDSLCRELVLRMRERGETDNITVGVILGGK